MEASLLLEGAEVGDIYATSTPMLFASGYSFEQFVFINRIKFLCANS